MKLDLTHVKTDQLEKAIKEQQQLIDFDRQEGTLTRERERMLKDEIKQAQHELNKRRNAQ